MHAFRSFFVSYNGQVSLAYSQEGYIVITDEQLNELRESGERVRIVRDDLEVNDVIGIIVAWSDEQIMVRRRNRRIVKLDRNYLIQLHSEPRISPSEM